LIDMQAPPVGRFTRIRHFLGVGRYPGTLRHVAAELSPEGDDYLPLPDEPPEEAPIPTLDAIHHALRESPSPLTRQDILTRWPGGEPRPTANGLWRALMRGCQLGILARTGAGTRIQTFRYGLAPGQSGF